MCTKHYIAITLRHYNIRTLHHYNLMQLGVYSLEKVLYQGEAVSVNCQTAAGEITILDHHQPLISILKKGVVKIIDKEKKEHYINASSGFLNVAKAAGGSQVKILIEA